MKPIYEEVKTANDKKVIKRTDADGSIWWIPMDESNSDYQAYLNKDKPQTPAVIDEATAE